MTNHTIVSFLKSAIRILGLVELGHGYLISAAFMLIFAELIGMVEELVP